MTKKPDPHHPGEGYYPQVGPDGIYRPLPSHPHLPPVVRPGGDGRWKWVAIPLGVIILIGIISVAASGGGGDDDDDGSPAAAPATSVETTSGGESTPAIEEKPKVDNDIVLYEVFGDAGQASSIFYTTDEDFGHSQDTQVQLPWSTTVKIKESTFNLVSLSAHNGPDGGTISCRITRGDEVEVENSATGPYASVTCRDN